MPPPPQPQRPMTLVEADPDLQWQLHALDPVPVPAGTGAAPVHQPAVKPYRPSNRPPVPLLTVCDDGSNDGEVIRIRGLQFTIGRTDGDLRLPADVLVSGRHAEIVCQQDGTAFRWAVIDLQSRNGVFLRVRRATLLHGSEFLVGQGRYRFEIPTPTATVDPRARPVDGGSTQGWDPGPAEPVPMVLEVLPTGIGARLPLMGPELWIGSDPTCAACRPQDPFVSPKHVQIFREGKGPWSVRNNGSPNGLWVRMPQFVVAKECAFQIGEQRFRLAVSA